MKSTAERLKSSYCVPKGAEWDAFGLIPLTGHKVMWLGGEPTLVSGEFTDRAEIPVSNFIDLLKDSIVAWRLEEDGFAYHENGGVPWWSFAFVKDDSAFDIQFLNNTIRVWVDSALIKTNIKSYPDLLTLIRLIG
jgi:hypothetical protein